MKRSFLPPLPPLALRLTGGRSAKRTLVLGLALCLAVLTAIALLVRHTADSGGSTGYRYTKLHSEDGVVLHVLETTPDRIRLVPIESNVTAAPYAGINGGFFWEGYLLSIAVQDGMPVKGLPEEYGSGWYNRGVDADLKRGTLVWDEAAGRFSIQLASDAGELEVTDPQHYWAQGGVSMSLSQDEEWEAHMIDEQMPAYDEERQRSGLVYDERQHVYLIVSPTPSTAAKFRSAILETLGKRGLVDGLYLDGDGSSQLRSKQKRLAGDQRPVYQMLAIIQ